MLKDTSLNQEALVFRLTVTFDLHEGRGGHANTLKNSCCSRGATVP